MNQNFSVILLLLAFSSVSVASDKLKYVMCRNNKVIRTIRVNWDESEQSCITKYTKNGIDKVIGEGKYFDSCITYLNNVKSNLEKANWSCRDISDAKLHELKPIKAENQIENG